MKIGLIGYGFVGKAVKYGFDNTYNEFFIVDPIFLDTYSVQSLCMAEPDIVFICVPSPTDMGWVQDDTIMLDTIQSLSDNNYKGVVVIKSTILPNFLLDYNISFVNLRIVYNPEFLTARFANEDFVNAPMIVLGGDPVDCERIKFCYRFNSNCKNVEDENFVITDTATASLIKYALNSWFATKIIFMNELYRIWKKSGSTARWDEITSALEKDERVGKSHNQVPGHDGFFGYGGMCFPKDTKAFYTYSTLLDQPFSLLKTVITDNEKIRKE